MILSPNQRSAVEHGDAVPITLDQTECIVIRRDVYEKNIQPSPDSLDTDVREAYPLMDAAARAAGWDDPSEDLYDDMVPKKS